MLLEEIAKQYAITYVSKLNEWKPLSKGNMLFVHCNSGLEDEVFEFAMKNQEVVLKVSNCEAEKMFKLLSSIGEST